MNTHTPATPPQEPPTFTDVHGAEARDAARELRGALDTVGITLPGLQLDPTRPTTSPKQLVELGSVRPHIACMLAAVIRRGGATPNKPTPPTTQRPTLTELAHQAETLAHRIHHHLERQPPRPETHPPPLDKNP